MRDGIVSYRYISSLVSEDLHRVNLQGTFASHHRKGQLKIASCKSLGRFMQIAWARSTHFCLLPLAEGFGKIEQHHGDVWGELSDVMCTDKSSFHTLNPCVPAYVTVCGFCKP